MRIRFIGQKGVPAVFGGVEYHVERLSEALVRRGHDVSVYVRPWYTPAGLTGHLGAHLIRRPTIRTKHADASIHSFLAAVESALSGADIVHFHAIGPGAFSLLPRLAGKKTVVTVHRLDWKTEKWGPAAGRLLRFGEWISARVPQATVVVSDELQRYFRERYGKETTLIPHGRVVPTPARPRLIRRLGLTGGDYIFFMGRFSPEKRVDWLIDSFREARRLRPAAFRGLKLVLAGGSSAASGVEKDLRDRAAGEAGIVFAGTVTGDEKSELLSNARLFVLPSSLEGLPIVLLEAQAYGLACLASDIAPHREVVSPPGKYGLLFDAGDRKDLTGKLIRLVAEPALAARLGRAAAERSSRRIGWDEVARRHEELYERVLGRKGSPSGRKGART